MLELSFCLNSSCASTNVKRTIMYSFTFILLNKTVFWCPFLEKNHILPYIILTECCLFGFFLIFSPWLWVDDTLYCRWWIISAWQLLSTHASVSWCIWELPSPFSSYSSLVMPCNPITDSSLLHFRFSVIFLAKAFSHTFILLSSSPVLLLQILRHISWGYIRKVILPIRYFDFSLYWQCLPNFKKKN